jgi:hypothetical protein
MSQRDPPRLKAFAVAAGAVAVGASLLVVGATHNDRSRRSRPGGTSGHVARVVVGQATTLPSPPRAGPRLSTASATLTARRFATSWQNWDTGRRSRQAAATLQRLSVAALWRRLRQQHGRPTAVRPPASLGFEAIRATASGRGVWRAPLIRRHPRSSYLGTLVIVMTSAGPRVSAIER